MNLPFKGVFEKLSSATDRETSLKNENQFFSSLLITILILATLLSIFGGYFIFHADAYRIITDGIHLLVLSVAFWLVSKYFKNEKVKMYVFSALLFVILIFTNSRFYYLIGPAVWTTSFQILIIMLIYSRRTMFVLYSISCGITLIYMWFNYLEFDQWNNYYIAQLVIFIMMFLAIQFVVKVTHSRSTKLQSQYEELNISKDKLLSTLLSVGDGVITVDVDHCIELINPISEKLTGWTQAEAKGQHIDTVFKVVNEYTREPIKNIVEVVFETKEIVKLANHSVLISKNGSERSIEDTAAPIKDKSGQVIGCVLVFRDFHDHKEKQKKIEYLSYHDQLTGVYNRRYLDEEIKRIDVKRNLPISFIYADVNGLKVINDAFGHKKGDQLIKIVADTIKSVCRVDDIISRYGGDEFVILLPNTDSDAARMLVYRINEQIESQKMMDIQLSVSFGYDTKVEQFTSAIDVLQTAEENMYQKKIFNNRSKRNGIIKAILHALLVKSPREEAHSRRVSDLCKSIGKAYNLDSDSIKELTISGELHDIGKIAIDASILNKKEKLTDSEWSQITNHPEIGYRLLGATREFYKISDYIHSHHENWDGTGYPKGIKGNNINWNARVISVADSYDAMISDRPYRKALTKSEAVEEIKRCAGKQFDPDIAKTFIEKVLKSKW